MRGAHRERDRARPLGAGLGAGALLFLLAFAIRSLTWPAVLWGGRVFPCDTDALYHLRRIAYSVARFPRALVFDPYLDFPHGAKPIWPPSFDWLLALLLRPFLPRLRAGDLEGLVELERLAVWIPPLLGAATAAALYGLVRRHFDGRVALLAGLFLCVLSAHVWYSQIGFLDHHVAEAFTAVLLLAAGMGAADAHARGAPLTGRGLALGAALAAALLVWPGSLIHAGLVGSALALVLVRCPGRRAAQRLALALATACGSAALWIAPLAWPNRWPQWSAFTPVVLSRFQPLLFGGLAALGLACAALWQTQPAGRSRRARLLAGLLAAAGLAGLGALLAPGLGDGAGEAWRWLFKAERFQAQVGESQPLLLQQGRLAPGLAALRLSLFVFAFPLIALACAWSVRRERVRAPALMLLWFATVLFGLTLLQRRFFNAFSVGLAPVLAWFLCGVYDALPPHVRAEPARRRRAWLALAAVAGAAFAPVLLSYRVPLANAIAALGGAPPLLRLDQLRMRRADELARWLASHTPPTAGWLDAARPEYGVLAPWPLGHALVYRGRRPSVTGPFGDDLGPVNFELVRRYFASAEPAAAQLLDRLAVRYVVAGASGSFLDGKPGPDSMFFALYYRDGSERGEPREGSRALEALARHRLRYETAGADLQGPRAPSGYKLFEYVRGARIAGRAPGGRLVQARVALRTNRGRELRYTTSAVADREGRYELRVPYANRGSPPAVQVGPHYEVGCAGRVAAVAVSEADVQLGRRIEGPSPACPPAPGPAPPSAAPALL